MFPNTTSCDDLDENVCAIDCEAESERYPQTLQVIGFLDFVIATIYNNVGDNSEKTSVKMKRGLSIDR